MNTTLSSGLFHAKSPLDVLKAKLKFPLCLSHVDQAISPIKIEGKVTSHGPNLHEGSGPDPGFILSLSHVPGVMHLVLDPPVAANPVGQGWGTLTQTGDVVAGFSSFFIARMAH